MDTSTNHAQKTRNPSTNHAQKHTNHAHREQEMYQLISHEKLAAHLQLIN
jgi:hypothetical protein